MPNLKLTWDTAKHLYSLPVMLVYRPMTSVGIPGEVKPTYTRTNTVLYIDTGSSVTSITETEALALGIDIGTLPTESIAGIGGIIKHSMAKNITFVALSNGKPLQATLDKIAVLPLEVKKKVEKRRGVYVERGFASSKMFSLCGLDLLEKWKGKVYLDPIARNGHIEFG